MIFGGDSKTALTLLEDVDARGVIADKAYDSNEIRDAIVAEGRAAVIPSKRTRKSRIRHDGEPSTKPETASKLLQQAQTFSPRRNPV